MLPAAGWRVHPGGAGALGQPDAAPAGEHARLPSSLHECMHGCTPARLDACAPFPGERVPAGLRACAAPTHCPESGTAQRAPPTWIASLFPGIAAGGDGCHGVRGGCPPALVCLWAGACEGGPGSRRRSSGSSSGSAGSASSGSGSGSGSGSRRRPAASAAATQLGWAGERRQLGAAAFWVPHPLAAGQHHAPASGVAREPGPSRHAASGPPRPCLARGRLAAVCRGRGGGRGGLLAAARGRSVMAFGVGCFPGLCFIPAAL